MRHTLSRQGTHLYLNGMSNGMTTDPPRNWARKLIYNLFHSDYDERLEDVVYKCRESTKGLCAKFIQTDLRASLDSSVLHTIQLILTRDDKFASKRHIEMSYRFFLDVMWTAFQQQDHQTAHMIYLSLTHSIITKLHVKAPKRAERLLERVKSEYGDPTYQKHIKFWRTVRSDDVLPSLIAFSIFIARRRFMNRDSEAEEALAQMEIFQYLEHRHSEIMPIYNQEPMTTVELSKLSKQIN
jgi:hypothetical protein